MRFIDHVIEFLIIKKIHLPHWHHSRLDFQKIDWKQIKIKVMNCLDSRENSPCRYISYLYILLRLKGQHTDKMAQNIQTVSMEIQTSEKSEAVI